MGLLNSGTLNGGEPLRYCCSRPRTGKSGERIPWNTATMCGHLTNGASTSHFESFGSLEWTSIHYCFWPIEIPPSREYSITRNTPRMCLVGEGEIWNGVLVAANLEQVDDTDASEFRDEKPNSKEMISPKLVKIPKTANGKLKIYWRKSGSENSTLTRCHPRSRRSAKWLSWRLRRVSTNNKAWIRCASPVYTVISDDLANSQELLRKILDKFGHELLQQADLRRRAQRKTSRQNFQSGNTDVESANKGWKIHVHPAHGKLWRNANSIHSMHVAGAGAEKDCVQVSNVSYLVHVHLTAWWTPKVRFEYLCRGGNTAANFWHDAHRHAENLWR